MMERGIFHIILVIALAVTLPVCVVSAADLTVVTSDVGVTATEAIFNGQVTDLGVESQVSVFFRYGTDEILATYERAEAGIRDYVDVFSVPVSWLAPNTPYYFQACAKPSAIVGDEADVCGAIASFWTQNPVVVPAVGVITTDVTSVTETEATMSGQVTDLGMEPQVAVFFRYGTDETLVTYERAEAGVRDYVDVFSVPVS
ncbi:MAG: hypothetical protein LBV40_01215, partial [Methanomicrobiales archaeon]|nr:hypothetical protein [Methanomicrobiales archaeon]